MSISAKRIVSPAGEARLLSFLVLVLRAPSFVVTAYSGKRLQLGLPWITMRDYENFAIISPGEYRKVALKGLGVFVWGCCGLLDSVTCM